MLDLGPTFIKVGQVLSTRPDIVPAVYAEEFATLQDAVPAGPYREMIPTVAEDIGYHSYDEFEPEPMAGGSLAQVYEATYEGENVVVKVRRPDIKDLIETDLRVLRRLLPVAIVFAPEQYHFSLRNMADDFERIIQEELDFEREARMMEEIRTNFADDSTVKIPRVYTELSSERVLTMERVDGIKITDVDELERAGFDPTEIAYNVANAYFAMGLEHGVFHGDPHPGNLAVNEDGQIVFYDFGMSGRFTPEMQDTVIDLYLAVVRRDVDTIMELLIDLGALDPTVDRAAMISVLNLIIEDLEGQGVSNWRIILNEVLTRLRDVPFRIPPDVMLVIRVGTVSEGVLRQLDPEFDFIEAAREFLVEHGFMERGARMLFADVREETEASLRALVRTPVKFEQVLDMAIRGEFEARRREADAKMYVRAVGRPLAYAVLVGSGMIGAAMLTTVDRLYGVVGFAVVAVLFVLFLRSLRLSHGSD
jgi:predicted unusual protein kinase regulating ubiquinone biosynthesis (AarF/ABC1/UbiB family)